MKRWFLPILLVMILLTPGVRRLCGNAGIHRPDSRL